MPMTGSYLWLQVARLCYSGSLRDVSGLYLPMMVSLGFPRAYGFSGSGSRNYGVGFSGYSFSFHAGLIRVVHGLYWLQGLAFWPRTSGLKG